MPPAAAGSQFMRGFRFCRPPCPLRAKSRSRFGCHPTNWCSRRAVGSGAHGQALHLGPHAFDLLVALVGDSGLLVTKDELFDRVWGKVVVEDNTLQALATESWSRRRRCCAPSCASCATEPDSGRACETQQPNRANVHRFWYGWKMWSFAFTATWHTCPQSEGLGSAVNLSDAAS
jgi:hypothetical protein